MLTQSKDIIAILYLTVLAACGIKDTVEIYIRSLRIKILAVSPNVMFNCMCVIWCWLLCSFKLCLFYGQVEVKLIRLDFNKEDYMDKYQCLSAGRRTTAKIKQGSLSLV